MSGLAFESNASLVAITDHGSWLRLPPTPSDEERRSGVEGLRVGAALDRKYDGGWWDGEGAFDWKRALSGGGSHASLGVCGREKAGGQQLASMLAAAAAGELDAGDGRGWLTRMAAVLRDQAKLYEVQCSAERERETNKALYGKNRW